MASSVETVQYICDQAGLGARLTYRRMFGEYALYLDAKVVAFIFDDQLFLKPTAAGKALLGRVTEAPLFPGSKNYFVMSAELDDPERLNAALLVTARALPEAKASTRRRPAVRKAPAKKKASPRGKKAAKKK